MSLIETIHGRYVTNRRARVLSKLLADLFPPNARVLDVGCGDGQVAALIAQHRPDLTLRGIDVLVRPSTLIPVEPFDGSVIPYEAGSFDAVLMVDVLHHTDDPEALLREATRVARQAVVLKDHLLEGFLAGPTLRFMDHVGNARHGVRLPYNYWPRARWQQACATLGLTAEVWRESLGLYRWPASQLFGRKLHFIARLGVPVSPERPLVESFSCSR